MTPASRCPHRFPNALQVSTIQADELREMGAGLITAVGQVCLPISEVLLGTKFTHPLTVLLQAAAVPPRVVFVEYRGNPEDSSFHGLLGKGVTYDTVSEYECV